MIATTGGYIGDAPPYQGHVAVLDPASGKVLQIWNSLCSDRHALIDPASCPASDSAIWGRAGAVVDPATGDLLVATGNAPWDGHTNWGDALLVLNSSATKLIGNYTPTNTADLNSGDVDLGSTSPVILSPGFVAQGGKDGIIRLLSRKRVQGAAAHKGGELQTVPTPSGTDLFTAPAVWHSTATWMFAGDNGGTAAYVFKNGRLRIAWRNSTAGTSPVVAGGLLWVYSPGGGLNVYRPTTGGLVTPPRLGRRATGTARSSSTVASRSPRETPTVIRRPACSTSGGCIEPRRARRRVGCRARARPPGRSRRRRP